ncbi:MAG: UvrD-helicase domain-containing protein, partial [Victivallales bacterium]|nr:UvrD-helicase domain-containing protein [Victivallales bacterium]
MEMTFDTQILEPGFDMSGTHLVAASAGTGKTYNIQNIYARIIMENDCQVSQVQVMTFTEAATKELKDRLHAVLKDLQHRFAKEPKPCEGKDEEDTARRNERADRLIACAADKAKARQRVELALLDFDNAAITTIHGFCQRVLTRYACETGITLAMTIE